MEELISCKKAVAKVVAGAPNVSAFDPFSSQLGHLSASKSLRVSDLYIIIFLLLNPLPL